MIWFDRWAKIVCGPFYDPTSRHHRQFAWFIFASVLAPVVIAIGALIGFASNPPS